MSRQNCRPLLIAVYRCWGRGCRTAESAVRVCQCNIMTRGNLQIIYQDSSAGRRSVSATFYPLLLAQDTF